MSNFEEMDEFELERLVNEGRLNDILPGLAGTNQNVESVPEATPTFVPEPEIAPVPIAPPVTQEIRSRIIEPQRVDGFDIKDPVELLFLLDDQVRDGIVKLHGWQIQFMLDFANGERTDNNPFQALVRACNGSGKDKYVIAPCVVWLCMAYIKARGVVTSSSGKQLDSQTCTYIDMLCNEANRKIAPGIWKINYRYYECLATGSPIECFATDEPGKAEGFHPLEYGRKMGLFMSEAKTVPDEVNTAFNKCTGYTHRCHVSTPGLPLGHFHDYCDRSPLRKDFKSIFDINPIDYLQYHITAYDCSHLSTVYIEQMKRDLPGGEFGAAFKSQVMAEFGTTDEMVVIPYTYVWRSMHAVKVGHLKEDFNTGGLDLSAGGDETVLAVRNGNKLIALVPFKFDNTQDTIDFLEKQFVIYGLNDPRATVWADAGGLGKPMIDALRRKGWSNMRYVLNQAKPYDERVYHNRGAEMWFNFGKLLEHSEVWLLDDEKLRKQLATRYYIITAQNKHQLESKLKARSKGHPSPDRGDAVVLCYSNYKTKLDQPKYEKPFKQEPEPLPRVQLTIGEWAGRGVGSDKLTSTNPSRFKDFRVYKTAIARYNEQLAALKN